MMHIGTCGPYALEAIHYFKIDSGAQCRALIVSDGNGNQLSLTATTLDELRRIASAFPLAENASLSLSLHDTPVRTHATIRRWIAGRPLDTANAATPIDSGLHVAGLDA
jgi:hypothetical protein